MKTIDKIVKSVKEYPEEWEINESSELGYPLFRLRGFKEKGYSSEQKFPLVIIKDLTLTLFNLLEVTIDGYEYKMNIFEWCKLRMVINKCKKKYFRDKHTKLQMKIDKYNGR